VTNGGGKGLEDARIRGCKDEDLRIEISGW
jgi:hypothetical protein